MSQAKEKERILRTHEKGDKLISRKTNIFGKIMPNHINDLNEYTSCYLEGLLDVVDTHFESLEKYTMIKV